MTRTVQFTIPAPCGWINSNQRLHRQAEAKLTKQWRAAGLLSVGPDWEPFDGPVHVTAWFTKARAGRYDPNNLWPTVKAVLDGVVDSGLLVDDDHVHVVGPDMRHGGKGEPAVLLRIVRM
ncbi:hypothetical protein ACFFGR_09400 [Arthrobacter liuii]|uniref:RusA-like resolvase n=1 Tax=Arthrobacter liuii TaxID=1476996 RepID=A0ABQ2AM24_9MICC|nr:hypothetical protein [Arthrobacter liuii]GGH93883.1 hypothetical protein GCM10007170_15790 [Arthrobacter liuii]